MYRIEVEFHDSAWTIFRRWRQFLEVDTAVRHTHALEYSGFIPSLFLSLYLSCFSSFHGTPTSHPVQCRHVVKDYKSDIVNYVKENRAQKVDLLLDYRRQGLDTFLKMIEKTCRGAPIRFHSLEISPTYTCFAPLWLCLYSLDVFQVPFLMIHLWIVLRTVFGSWTAW